MKKYKKNLSKTIFATFFIFQFVIATAFMPVVAFAQDEVKVEKKDEASDPIKAEEVKVEKETKEEIVKDEEVKVEDESEVKDEEFVSDSETTNDSETSNESDDNSQESQSDEGEVLGESAVSKLTPNYCDSSINLVQNGGFENPSVYGSWNIYQDGTPGLGWMVTWQPGSGDGTPAKMEIHDNVNSWSPQEGTQYVELDSDFDGPGGSINNEEASTKISQVINVVPGQSYEIKFYVSARPGTDMDDNRIAFYVDDSIWDGSFSTTGVGNTDTYWIERSYVIPGNLITKNQMTIGIGDIGTANSYGSFVDNVSVNCVDDNQPQTGSITVCKLIMIGQEIFDGSDNPGEVFSISGLAKPAHLDSSFNHAGIIGNSVFTTPLAYNADLFLNDRYDDVQCITYNNLIPGNYFYGEEVVPAGWATPRYNDGVNGTVSDLSDFHPYSNELFTNDGGIDDGSRNTKSDGHIVLGAGAHRTLVVLNEYEGQGPSCDPLYARVVFAGGAYGSRNWGSGDMSKTAYVGSDSNSYGDGEWFMVHDGANFINDADIASYRDVPGIAVQRLNDSLRVVLNGFHDNSTETNKEAAQGYIELSRDMSTRLTNAWDKGNGFIDPIDNDSHTGTRLHDPEVNDSENPMDSRGNFVGYIHYNNPRFDNVSIDNDLFKFRLIVTTASDGFYADYTYDVDDCEPVNNPPVITVDPEVITVTVGTSVDVLFGVSASDIEDGVIPTGNIVVGGDAVDTNTIGTYVVTYDVDDSDGMSAAQKTRTINVVEDGGNGDGNPPVITVNPEEITLNIGSTYDILNAVYASDIEDGDITIDIAVGGDTVDLDTVGDYLVTYDVVDSDGNSAVQKTRLIHVVEDGGNGGGGSGGGGGGGCILADGCFGDPEGEVLGAATGPSCPHFVEYLRRGSTGEEVVKWQEFLNEYMQAGLSVDGVYGPMTEQAVHNFQAKHWDEIINPWTPPLSPNTTGRVYKTTLATGEWIVGCVPEKVFLEDPAIEWQLNASQDIFGLEADLRGVEDNSTSTNR